VRFSTILMALILSFLTHLALAQEKDAPQVRKVTQKNSVESEHQRAVQLAHDDQLDASLVILRELLNAHPDNYPVRRDYVVISSWAGNCDATINEFQPIKNRPNKEDYLITAVAQCMSSTRNNDEALALLREGTRSYPDNEEIKSQYKALLNDIVLDSKPELNISAGTGQSDGGNQDYFFQAKYSRQFAPGARWYARYFTTFAQDPEYDTGDLDRVGAGIMYWFNPKWYLDQEFSTDISESGEEGFTTTLIFYPTSQWDLTAQYTSFAEDVPLRAKAIGVTSDRAMVSAYFHSLDYRWEWFGSYSDYDFTDTNHRQSYYTELGYAYEMLGYREQRVILEVSGSSNTLANTVYYNPLSDSTISLANRTTFVFDSSFDRHVDHATVFIGEYDEEGYGTNVVYGASYEQQYDFNPIHSFNWWLQVASQVFDGERETIVSFLVNYNRRFM